MDMHLNDTNDEYLSKLDIDELVSHLKNANVSSYVVKAHSHVGLNYWPSKYGKMHRILEKRGIDYVGEMIEKCHASSIKTIVYFSQIYDNYAYENHSDWRLLNEDGLTSYDINPNEKARYGLVCPNNPDYRQYCKNILTELCSKYQFEGMFLDMPFWPYPCYCEHCQRKYFEETGKKIPSLKEHTDEQWQEFVHIRQQWMQEFILENTNAVKSVNPAISIEHNMAAIGENWGCANVEMNTDASDYAGGDYYGGYLQQSFMCKYYNNITVNKPFSYITSRCDKNLYAHTVSRTKQDLMIHCINALFHNGAFSICDALNPDGTFTQKLYKTDIKDVYEESAKLEKYVSGDLNADVAVLYSTNCKMNDDYISAPLSFVKLLRENNVLFDVVGSRNLKSLKAKVLCLGGVYEFTDEEIEDIKSYVQNGGSVLMSGSCAADERLINLAGLSFLQKSDYTYCYAEPRAEFSQNMKSFDSQSPYPIESRANECRVIDENVCVLATLTYPYTKRSERDFSAIHSDPPGIHTDLPAITLNSLGKGKIMYLAAPMEKTQAYYCRRSLCDIILYLMDNKPLLSSNAPEFVEILSWEKDGYTYVGLINQQEITPVYPINNIKIKFAEKYNAVEVLSNNADVKLEDNCGGCSVVIDEIDVYILIRLTK